MNARVIVTQQSKTVAAPEGLKHRGYDVGELGLGILGGLQILSDPGWEIAAVYIVEANEVTAVDNYHQQH
jgi:hypothetical protein